MSLISGKRRGREYFDHQADIGIVGFGASLQEAFEEAAVAMFDLIVDVSRVEPRDEIAIECQAADKEEL
ncbi:MAG: archease, partial [Gemmatimonadota bacterium]